MLDARRTEFSYWLSLPCRALSGQSATYAFIRKSREIDMISSQVLLVMFHNFF